MTSAQLSSRQQTVLTEMGIDIWVSRNKLPPEPDVAAVVERPTAPVDAGVADAWLALNKEILTCTSCELHQTRTQAVCGVGNLAADILVIGEAPGADEDQQGEPFIGRAGQLLNEMLRAVGMAREDVFIANILKCRPPENRDPRPAEVENCLPYLQRQIALIQPRLILVVGRIAAQNLLNVETPIGRLRGQVHSCSGPDGEQIPVVVTYHPAYLLRSPAQKSKSWQDLLLALDVLAGASVAGKTV